MNLLPGGIQNRLIVVSSLTWSEDESRGLAEFSEDYSVSRDLRAFVMLKVWRFAKGVARQTTLEVGSQIYALGYWGLKSSRDYDPLCGDLNTIKSFKMYFQVKVGCLEMYTLVV